MFIAVRGPDPEGWQPDRKPDFDDPAETLVITDRAQVVATYAPRVRYDGWQRHPGSSISPDRRLKPFITLAEQGKTEYVIHVDLPEAGDRPEAGQGSGSGSNGDSRSNGGNRSNGGSDSFQAAVADLVRCIKIISGGAKIQVAHVRTQDRRVITLHQNDEQPWSHPDAYHLFTAADNDVVIEAGHIDGLRNGIYGLLTDHLDCH